MLNRNIDSIMLTDAMREYSLSASPEKLKNIILNHTETVDEHTKLLVLKAFEHDDTLCVILADYYNKGNLVRQDEIKAIELYDRAYKNGHMLGCLKLGEFYYLNENYMKAIEYFAECLRNESEFSDYELGYCNATIGDSYMRIVSPNLAKAKEHLEKAVEKYNDAYAGYRLGQLYSDKSSNIYDPIKALRFYELGSRNGHTGAAVVLGEKYAFGDEDAGIEENRFDAIALLEQHENTDDVEVFELLGRIYLSRYDDEMPDYDKAREYFKRVLDVNSTYFKRGYIEQFLGYISYMTSDYDNYSEAINLLKIADSNGFYRYSGLLGHIYKNSIENNPRDFMQYYENAYLEGTINLFQCAEYAEILSDLNNSEKAYEVAEHGVEHYNDVVFYLIQAKLVLLNKVNNKMTKREAAALMEDLKNYDSLKNNDYILLGNYYMEVGEYRLAETNYHIAFKNGESEAGLILARLYERGAGSIQPNVQTAVEWYRNAATAGNEEAKRELNCFTEKLFGGYKRVRSL